MTNRPVGRNGERNLRREKGSNAAHASTTDSEARLARQSGDQESRMGFTGYLLMANRNGLIVGARLTRATGTAKPEAALDMLGELPTAGNDGVAEIGRYAALHRLPECVHAAGGRGLAGGLLQGGQPLGEPSRVCRAPIPRKPSGRQHAQVSD
jgi:hypothetical protein